ncbi:MAG: hypothetical protein NT140_10495 [Deltaproteobacteria bacterium]|nr:hypothetical protein [Deltaproteobacteria bacterium]
MLYTITPIDKRSSQEDMAILFTEPMSCPEDALALTHANSFSFAGTELLPIVVTPYLVL